MKRNEIIMVAAGAVLLVAATAGASTYIANPDIFKSSAVTEEESVAAIAPAAGSARVPQQPVQQQAVQQQPIQANAEPAKPRCDDDNIVGKVAGGIVGGLLGNEIGSGRGNTAATIGGSVGGTLLGEEFIPTQNVTCG